MVGPRTGCKTLKVICSIVLPKYAFSFQTFVTFVSKNTECPFSDCDSLISAVFFNSNAFLLFYSENVTFVTLDHTNFHRLIAIRNQYQKPAHNIIPVSS